MHTFLNETEVEKIEAFCRDEVMHNAVKKVILHHIYSHGVLVAGESHDPFKNRAFALVADNVNNEQLGLNIKAWFEGVNALEQGFKELKSIKSPDKELIKSPFNIAE